MKMRENETADDGMESAGETRAEETRAEEAAAGETTAEEAAAGETTAEEAGGGETGGGEAREPYLARTREETDQKCPSCGGIMSFSPKTGGLLCPYCGLQEEIEGGEERAEELDFSQAGQQENCDWGAATKVVVCRACGAESLYDELQLAMVCPYCGSNQVMEEKGKDTMAPGGVVPFGIESSQAAAKFRTWIRWKPFCPRAAKESVKPGAFQGIYLPYWTFDADTESRYRARYGRDRTVRRDGKEVTQTDWYTTQGTWRERTNDQLVPGTDRHDEALMQKIEPFSTEANRKYKPEYIAGFAAERYSIGLAQAWQTGKELIEERLKKEITEEIRRSHLADHVTGLRMETSYRDVTFQYLLLPVWLSGYTYKGKTYQFLVNGQTGKAGGKTPVSLLRVLIALLLCTEFLAMRSVDWQYLAAGALLIAGLAVFAWFRKL